MLNDGVQSLLDKLDSHIEAKNNQEYEDIKMKISEILAKIRGN